MSDKTAIEWADATWSPATGCTKVSPGCANCYIERTPPFRMAGRHFVKGRIPVLLHADRLDQPLRWRKARRVFVCSLADLFQEDVPDEFLDRVWATMALAKQHQFQVLTKRPERMRAYIQDRIGWRIGWPLPNVHLGVSVENQRFADERIPVLLDTPAAVRFVSCEPLLGSLDIDRWLGDDCCFERREAGKCRCAFQGSGIDWVIVGGESGPKARPMKLDWVRDLRDQCVGAGVPFFFKQGSGRLPGENRLLDGRTWEEIPDALQRPAASERSKS